MIGGNIIYKNVTVAGGGISGEQIAVQRQFMGFYELPTPKYQQESSLNRVYQHKA